MVIFSAQKWTHLKNIPNNQPLLRDIFGVSFSGLGGGFLPTKVNFDRNVKIKLMKIDSYIKIYLIININNYTVSCQELHQPAIGSVGCIILLKQRHLLACQEEFLLFYVLKLNKLY